MDNSESQILENKMKKLIIDKVVSQLSKTNPDLYYVDSSTISHLIKEYIEGGNLNQSDYEIVKDLSPKDISIITSYASNCC